jgi:L-lactate dehydrogenase (cytochrome)
MVSSNASFSPRDIMEAADTTQTLFFQLYKHNDEIAEKLVREVEELGYKAIFLTVDALVTGKRERDIRCPWMLEDEENGGPTEFYVEGIAPSKEMDMLGTAGALNSKIDRDITWDKVGTPCAWRDFVSDAFMLDHSLATKDIQTSHRY